MFNFDFNPLRKSCLVILIRHLALPDSDSFILFLKMSSGAVYNCVTCSKTIEGKQHYANCVSCLRRVHRMCYGEGLSNDLWAVLRQKFTCSACKARVSALPVPVLATHVKSNDCSDGKGRLEENVTTYVPTILYEIMIGASRLGGDIVNDGSGYTYSFKIDYQNFRVWKCTYAVKIPR